MTLWGRIVKGGIQPEQKNNNLSYCNGFQKCNKSCTWFGSYNPKKIIFFLKEILEIKIDLKILFNYYRWQKVISLDATNIFWIKIWQGMHFITHCTFWCLGINSKQIALKYDEDKGLFSETLKTLYNAITYMGIYNGQTNCTITIWCYILSSNLKDYELIKNCVQNNFQWGMSCEM